MQNFSKLLLIIFTESFRTHQMDNKEDLNENQQEDKNDDHTSHILKRISECKKTQEKIKPILNEEFKPALRGRIHQIAFYKTIVFIFFYLGVSYYYYMFKLGIMIHLLSQLALYGISSAYHTIKWKTERMRRFFQRLDHTSIFLLISGTQTSVFITLLPEVKRSIIFLITTWSITIFGIGKIFLFTNIVEFVDVLIYIVHGLAVIPFFKLLKQVLRPLDWVLFIMGGAFYIVGGIVFGLHYPNPIPTIFGYHEVFHVLTVLAEMCFMIPMCVRYIKALK
ncbi:hemolysin III family channel protein [Edhazardia aedis USNM 41457]|uniref:Hemolysin III family channel protein n=1 Tax=Edhazardia aedis (strain USNM 41457) TaxID=1003232 RepID=J8ZW25_EDHAE|nr:hemolysin III family channel protein [Edhazardia aedis USNM 41457]|eukprot:EJW03883.1 hemolysin III family channel protein [Edhazardia aedis USNM 41457]